MRFLAVFGIAYAGNLALVLGLRRAGVDPAIAHAAGMPVYTLIFFALSRWFVFTPHVPSPTADLSRPIRGSRR
jgi:putative flippase GtrA